MDSGYARLPASELPDLWHTTKRYASGQGSPSIAVDEWMYEGQSPEFSGTQSDWSETRSALIDPVNIALHSRIPGACTRRNEILRVGFCNHNGAPAVAAGLPLQTHYGVEIQGLDDTVSPTRSGRIWRSTNASLQDGILPDPILCHVRLVRGVVLRTQKPVQPHF